MIPRCQKTQGAKRITASLTQELPSGLGNAAFSTTHYTPRKVERSIKIAVLELLKSIKIVHNNSDGVKNPRTRPRSWQLRRKSLP